MKKLMTLLGVMAFALGAFAANISGVNFDNVTSLGKLSSNTGDNPTMTPGTTGSTTFWYSAAGEDLDASVTAYADDQPVQTTVASGESNVNYLKIESAPYTAPLYRSITANTQDGDFVARSIGDGLYIDTLVQFTVGSDTAELQDSAAKLALWVGTSEDTENAPTNIFVRAGYISESGLAATNYVFEVPANFSPENWYRVTVKAINNIVSEGTYVGFVVFVDGVALEPGANTISDNPLTLAPAVSKFSGKIFPSMINSGDLKQTLSAVGFSGTGAVDDLAFTATAPFDGAMDQVAFRLEWDTHVATLGVTIGGVPQEVDVEDLSKVFLYNVSDTVSISITYENGYTSTYGNAVEFTENVPDVITIETYAPGAAYWDGSAWVNVADIDAALDAVGENGGTIKLLAAETQLSDAGVTIDPGVGNVVVFDLAGKTLLGAEDGPIFLVDSGTLVITNSTPEVGEILAYDRDFADDGSIVVASGAALKVYGGLIDGIIVGDDLGSGFDDGVLQIFGGKFYDSTMTSAEDDFAYAPYVAEGKYATPAQDEGVWYVTVGDEAPTPPPAETFVISIVKTDFTTNKYETVGEAFEAIEEGDKLVVLDDLELALPSDCSNDIEIPDGVAITFVEGDYTFSGTFDGAGTVAMTARPKAYVYTGDANGGTLFAETWAGTFQVAWNPGNACFVFDDFGNANSVVEIVGSEGSFGAFPSTFWSGSTVGAPSIAPAIVVACNWTIANGWRDSTTTFAKLSGTGNLTINDSYKRYYSIGTVDGYSGTITTGKHEVRYVNIVKAGADFTTCLVKGGDTFVCNLAGAQLNGVAATLAVGTVNEQKGIYLARAAVNGTGYLTVAEAIAAAEAACANTVVVLDESTAEVQGWTLDNGVYTYASSRAYIGETGYPTLTAAVAAAGENKVTIDLVDHIWEDVTVPANVTVEVADDVQIRGGTLSGAGRFVYTKVPSQFRFTFNNWTGTVTLDYANIVSAGDLANQIVAYGDENSVVEIGPNGTVTGDSFLNSNLKATLMVNGYVSINNGASATKRLFPRVTGGGVLVFGNKGNMVNYDVQALVDWTGVITNNASKVLVTNIVSGAGAVVFNVEAPAVTVGESFDGSIVYNATPGGAPVVDADSECEVCLNFNYAGMNIAPYGNAKSTIKLGNLSADNAYLNDGSGSGTGRIPSKVIVAGNVTLNNGWTQYPEYDWTGSKTLQFNDFKVDRTFTLQSTRSWNDAQCYYYIKSLNGDGAGRITVGAGYSLRIDAVDFAEAPSGDDCIVPLTVGAATASAAAGNLYGADGELNGDIPVTVNGVATEQTLVYNAEKGGLVLYVEPSPSPAIDPSAPTELDVGPEATQEQAEEVAAAMDVTKTEDASAVDQATWNGYFTKTVEKVDDKWVATAALNPAAVLPVDDTVEEAKLTDMLESVTAAALDDKTPTAVPTKAGLYYWIAGATEVGATTYTPGTAALGDGTKKALTMPTLDDEDGKAFYKVCVGVEAPVAE